MNKLLLSVLIWLSMATAAHAQEIKGVSPPTPLPPAFTGEEVDIPVPQNLKDIWLKSGTYGLGAISTTVDHEGSFRFHCETSHLNYDDPILYPGIPGAAHGHMFFGNPTTNASSTFQSLRNNTTLQPTCTGAFLNNSAYWMPWLVDPFNPFGTPKIKKPKFAVIYYKCDWRDKDVCNGPPRGFKMIAGYNHIDPSHPTNNGVGWKCEGSNGSLAAGASPVVAGSNLQPYLKNPATGGATLVCPTSENLIMAVTTPQCWNGTSRDGSEYTGAGKGRNHLRGLFNSSEIGGRTCPSTHPYVLWHFDFSANFQHNGPDDYKEWYFSSDRMGSNPANWYNNGQTGHIDWFDGWSDEFRRNGFEINCIGVRDTTSRSCDSGQFGNSTFGEASGVVNMNNEADSATYLDIPTDPNPAMADPVVGKKTGAFSGPFSLMGGNIASGRTPFYVVALAGIALLALALALYLFIRRRRR